MIKQNQKGTAALSELDYKIEGDKLTLVLNGEFQQFNDAESLYQTVRTGKFRTIEIDGRQVTQWDSSLLLILFEVHNIAQSRKIAVNYTQIPEGLKRMLMLALAVTPHKTPPVHAQTGFLDNLGQWGIDLYQIFMKGWRFTLLNIGALLRFIRGKTVTRREDFLFALEDCGPRAVGIVALISFMVGLILAFVGAIQLKTFGAQIYVASLVTIGMTRIMGAIMVGVIMAGRTGASFAATLGTMQVNEEIDALKTMGIPPADFLVLPRLSALVLTMPFLTMLADFMGMFGGGFVGVMLLDIPAGEYWRYSWEAWSMTNFWVGIFHGFVFGFIIALCGCYYGINSGRNADGVGIATTKAVVSGIVWMIIATGIITVIFERLGI